MPLDLPASIQAQFATDNSKLARCVKLQLRDGTVYGFTDHDEDLEVDIGDGGGSVVYRSDFGLVTNDVDIAVGFEASSTEIEIPVKDTITRAKILGRQFNQAWVWVFDVDWSNSYKEPAATMKGWIADVSMQKHSAVLEIRSLQDYFNLVIGRILSPRCTATFGDTQCGVARVDNLCSVTEVISTMEFKVDLAGTLSDGYFRFGSADFINGELEFLWEVEVFDYVDADGLVTLLAPMPALPRVGDVLILRQGCTNVKSSTDGSLPTCSTYNNVERFRGFDRVPGSDAYYRVPIPGEN